MQKLTPGEITKTVEKIRRRYDEYAYKFFKRRSLKLAFEDRYLTALKSGADVSSFLLAEISAIQELIQREEAKVQGKADQLAQAERFSDKVDRVIAEQRQRMLRHPDVAFNNDASEELRHLLGAMSRLQEVHWEALVQLLRDTAYSRSSLALSNLESQLHYLAGLGSDNVSSGLSRYMYQLNRFPRNQKAIDREEQEYILECAFFLHDLNEILERVNQNYPQLRQESRDNLRSIQEYVLDVIRDFRLKDLKRRK